MRGAFAVLALGALYGLVVARSVAAPEARESRLVLDKALAITAPEQAAQAYFRRRFTLPRTPHHAWVKLAATDSFTLYVNGEEVGARAFTKTNVAGVYAVTERLVPGPNVLAVEVRRSSLPRVPALKLEAGIVDEAGREERVRTGDGWRAASLHQARGPVAWTDVGFDDSRWSRPVSAGRVLAESVEPVAASAAGVVPSPRGEPIWHPDPRARLVVLSTLLELPDAPRSGWIRISAAGGHRLTLNGEVASVRSLGEESYVVEDVGRFLKPGANEVVIESERTERSPLGGSADGRFDAGGAPVWLRTDPSWSATAFDPGVSRRTASAVPVPRSVSVLTPGLTRSSDSVRSRSFYARVALVAVFVLAGALAACAAWLLAGYLATRPVGLPLEAGLARLSLAHIPPLVVLTFLLIARFDVRHAHHPVYLSVVLGVLLLLVVSEIVVIAETWLRERQHAPEESPAPREEAV